jgi:hypothetical protein
MQLLARLGFILALLIFLSSCNSTGVDLTAVPSWTEEEMLSVGDLSQLGDGKMVIQKDGTSLIGGKKVPREFILGKWYGESKVSQQVFVDRKVWNTLSDDQKFKAGQISPLKAKETLRLLAMPRLTPQISAKLGTQAVIVLPGRWECWWIFCWWVEPVAPPPPPPPDNSFTDEPEYVLTPNGDYQLSAPDGIGLESVMPNVIHAQAIKVTPLQRYVNVWGTMSQSTSYQFDCSMVPISGSASTYIQGTASSTSETLLSRIYATSSVRRNAVTLSGAQLYPFGAVATTRSDSQGQTTSQDAVARFESTCIGFKAYTEPGYGLVTRNYRSTGWHKFIPPKGNSLSFYTQSPTW